ncbi:MAG TPA: phage tail protein [Nitrospira sp.]|nr:phage tail protein [Nitrospira sp.]
MNWASIILGPLTVKILDWLFKTPAQADATAAKFGDFNIPRSKYGDPAPLLYGTARQKSPLTLWFGDYNPVPIKKKQSTGLFSSKRVIVGYKNYIGMDMLLSIGPGHVLKQIWVDNTSIWTGNLTTDSSININKPNQFGGDDQRGGYVGKMSFYTGGSSPVQNAYLKKILGPNVPAYNGFCRVVMEAFYIGTSAQVPVPSFEMSRLTNGLSASYSIMPNGLDLNPLEIAYDAFTQQYGRFGLPVAVIDLPSWLAAAQTLYNEGMGMTFLIQSAITGKDLLNELMDVSDGFMYQEPSNRKMVVKLVRADYNVATLDTLDQSIVSDISNFGKNTWDQTFNQCRVTFADRANSYDDSIAMQTDFANINFQQKVVSTNLTSAGIRDATVANKYAASQLSRANVPLYTATLKCNRKAAKYRPGDVVLLNWSPFGLTGMVMRIGKVELGELVKGVVTLTVAQDRYSTSTPIFAAPPPTYWPPVTFQPAPVTVRKIIELPYFFGSVAQPPGATDGILQALASPPASASISYRADMTANADTTFANATTVMEDAPYNGSGTLRDAYAALTGRSTGQDAVGFAVNLWLPTSAVPPSPGAFDNTGQTLLVIDNEIIGYTGCVVNPDGSYQFSGIRRALLDTDFADHSAGAQVYFLSGQDDQFNAYINNTSTQRIRLIDKAATATLDPSLALVDVFTLSQRTYKPAPPDYVQLNGSRTPISQYVSAAIAVTWRERNRKTATLVQYNDPTEVAEPGTDYGIRYRVNAGAWSARTFVTGVSYTIPALGNSYAGTVDVEVVSRRDGVISNVGDICTIVLTIETFHLMTSANELLTSSGGDYLRTM